MTAPAQSSLQLEDHRIREAGPADVEALTHLINAAFVVEQIAIEGDRVDPDKVRGYMARGKFLLLEDQTALLGCVYAEPRGEHGYVGLLSVDPARQGAGLGRQLMAAVEKTFREAGCAAVDLRIISARPELLRFYAKLGYAETGISPMPVDAPLKMACHFIHLSKPLR
ncbi:MAG TPA: GNAT family N-acetyltransferase [Candidatus Dormibacteraeota bacterium]|nr:GNAT family N-acetyltransferase [Candidatus Dormibacteraeota bacterium]